MKTIIISLLTLALTTAYAEEKIKMYFNNEELIKVIEMYSKASGQKFIIDSSLRGKISIFNQEPIAVEEAFNQLSSALAVNGYAISKQGDTMVVKSARNIQRDLIEVSKEKPSLKPERMFAWIYTAKNVPATTIVRDLRILPSKDGEQAIYETTNQIIFIDWTSNLLRISEIIKEIDVKVDPATAKLVEASKKQRETQKKEKVADKEGK